MKRFDDHFADNVREAFDNYHEEVDPRAFADLQQRLQQRRQRRVIAWLPAGIAASVLLVAAGWLLWHDLPTAPEKMHPQVVQTPAASPSPESQPAHKESLAEQPVQPAAQPAAPGLVASLPPEKTVKKHREEQTAAGPANDGQTSRALPEPAPEQYTLPADPTEVVLPPLRSQAPANEFAVAALQHDAYADHQARSRRQAWSVTAGSMMAFAPEGVSDVPGIAAGVMSEWQITPSLTLTTGGLLTYHQFELGSLSRREDFYAHVPGSELQGDMLVKGSSHYELLTLDIPLNARLDLAGSDKHRLYLGAGLSSVVFLQEHFRDEGILYSSHLVPHPQTGQMVSEIIHQRLSMEEKTGPFSRFDAARLLNLSMGYVMNGRRGSTTIEPFVKLPLGTLTSRNLHLGMAGFSVRYTFRQK